jgi:replicative DNA helicase
MLEQTIISNLLYNEDYTRKVFPYLKEEYFDDYSIKKIFSTYSDYMNEYKTPPSIEALKISLDSRKDLNEDSFKQIVKTVDGIEYNKDTNVQWLIDQTEKFCQDKDLYNSIRKAILILDGKDKELDKGAIPKLLSDSLGVSFDTHIGHDFLEDYNDRYDFYHKKEERIPFGIKLLNSITKGGLPNKSLTCFLAVTGVGKTLVMCDMAATHLLYGKNVLYITLEMAEERIAERIDANILDVTLDELKMMSREEYERKISRIKGKTTGKLIIKEYPTGSAHAGHIRYLINDLKMKHNFTPDIVYIDYLNLCSSSRLKGAAAANSYTVVKSIAEELRGLAMEFNIPVVSATQANRSAFESSDIDMTNTSESIGLAATVDAMFALISSEELERMKQIMIKQLKNRWGDLSYYRRFLVGIDRSKMKLIDLEESAQENIQNEVNTKKGSYGNNTEDKPVFDSSSYAEEFDIESKFSSRKKKRFDTGDIL